MDSWTTIRALEASSGDGDKLIAAGEVLNLRFRKGQKSLSLRAGKLFHLLVKAAGVDAPMDKAHSVQIAELNFAHAQADELIDCVRELVSTVIEVDTVSTNGKRYTKVGPFLSDVEREHDARNGQLRFQFSPVLRFVLARSTHWAALSRRATLAFESRYSLRLYELVSIRKGLKHRTAEVFPLDDLRARLGVPDGKLKAWVHLRQKAIEPAVAEVSQLTGLNVRYEPIKTQRAVTAVRLIWSEKSATARKETAKELDRPRVGRSARRNGTVEAVVETIALGSFPADGSIYFGRWADLARSHGGGYDVDLIAAEFRKFAAARNLPLANANIEKTFVAFCRSFQQRRGSLN